MNKIMFKDFVYMRTSYTKIQTPVKSDYIIYYQYYEIDVLLLFQCKDTKKRTNQQINSGFLI